MSDPYQNQQNTDPTQSYNQPFQPVGVDGAIDQVQNYADQAQSYGQQAQDYAQNVANDVAEYGAQFDTNPQSNDQPITQEPYQDYSYGVEAPEISDPNAVQYNAPIENTSAQGNNPEVFPEDVNTFEEKQTGNRFFLIGTVALVVILLAASIFLIYQNTIGANTNDDQTANTTITTNTPSTDTTDTNQEEETTEEEVTEPDFDFSVVGGKESLAAKARIRNASTIPADWIRQKFNTPDRDEDGNCLVETICGASADPFKSGMTNLEKYNFDLDPLVPDTNGNGIADGDDVYVYFLNPRDAANDADKDSYKDIDELANCYNPLQPSPNDRLSATRQIAIKEALQVRLLQPTTQDSLKAKGATEKDVTENGFVSAKCPSTTSATTPASTTAPVSTSTTQN